MQHVYDDLGITITPGPGPDTADDIVSFTLPGMDEQITIANSLCHQPSGIRTCACSLGIKKSGKLDFTVITLPHPGQAAAVFSQSHVFTPNGMHDLTRIAQLLEQEFGIAAEHTLISQTGWIGRPLPMEVFEAGIPHLAQTLHEHNLDAASEAILTTDSGPKVASVALGDIVIAGIVKGAGVVELNMATMLACFFTNAQLSASCLQELLVSGTNTSFNRLSIDADTSMNDTVALLSTGERPIQDRQLDDVRQALTAMTVKLVRDMASQGEGVTKMIKVMVDSDVSVDYAQRIAKRIINSPSVKTSLHGANLECGRILLAMGKPETGHADPRLAPDQVEITIEGQPVYRRGQPLDGSPNLGNETVIHIDVALGHGGF
jgi:glutamate N-acetyltransferase/amino-acid N-acetyltransferase